MLLSFILTIVVLIIGFLVMAALASMFLKVPSGHLKMTHEDEQRWTDDYHH